MASDTVFMTWYKPLVDPFKNKSLSLPPPNFEQDNFERLIERVPNFMGRILGLSVEERQLEFQRASLSGLAQFNVGMYSVFHDTAVWHDGYASRKAIRLAYMYVFSHIHFGLLFKSSLGSTLFWTAARPVFGSNRMSILKTGASLAKTSPLGLSGSLRVSGCLNGPRGRNHSSSTFLPRLESS